MKNLFRVNITVEIPAGVKFYINFYHQELPPLLVSLSTILRIEFKNMPNVPNRNLFGRKAAHLEVYGPFNEITECKITYNSTSNNINTVQLNKFSIGLYEKQMILPFGMCGNINQL